MADFYRVIYYRRCKVNGLQKASSSNGMFDPEKCFKEVALSWLSSPLKNRWARIECVECNEDGDYIKTLWEINNFEATAS